MTKLIDALCDDCQGFGRLKVEIRGKWYGDYVECHCSRDLDEPTPEEIDDGWPNYGVTVY